MISFDKEIKDIDSLIKEFEKTRVEDVVHFMKPFINPSDKMDLKEIFSKNAEDLVLLCLISLYKPNIEFNELKELIDKLSVLNKLKDNQKLIKPFTDLAQLLGHFQGKTDENAELKDMYIYSIDPLEIKENERRRYEYIVSSLNFIFGDSEDGDMAKEVFFDICNLYDAKIFEWLATIYKGYHSYKDKMKAYESTAQGKTALEKIVLGEILSEFDKLGITQGFQNIVAEYGMMEQQHTRECKEFSAIRKSLISIKEILQKAGKEGRITKLDLELLRKAKIDTPTIEHIIAKVLQFNDTIYNSTKARNYRLQESYTDKTNNPLKKALAKYGININSLNEEFRQSLHDKEALCPGEIDKMLTILKQADYPFLRNNYKLLVEILLTSSASALKNISICINSDYIDLDYLEAHLSIFAINEGDIKGEEPIIKETLYKVFASNMSLLRKSNIYIPHIKDFNPNILTMNSEALGNIILSLMEYGLNYNELASNYDILDYPSLIRVVDSFIELGLYDIVKNNPSIVTTNGESLIKRIILCQLLDKEFLTINSENKRELLPFVTSDVFEVDPGVVISDNDLDDYINNDVHCYIYEDLYQSLDSQEVFSPASHNTRTLEIIKALEHYKGNDQTYYFDDIAISKNKVQRNMETLLNESKKDNYFECIRNVAYTSILYGSILSDGQCQAIDKCLASLELSSEGTTSTKVK